LIDLLHAIAVFDLSFLGHAGSPFRERFFYIQREAIEEGKFVSKRSFLFFNEKEDRANFS
jgi:hypothetical protein